MRLRVLLPLCAFPLLICTACNRLSADGASAQNVYQAIPARIGSKDSISARNTVTIESTLSEMKPPSWKVFSMRVSDQANLKNIHFLDENQGWIGAGGVAYRTADGGKTWEQVKIDVPPKAGIAAIFFVNPSVGWIALERRSTDILKYHENQFQLMQTSNGGQTWHLQKEEKDSLITNVSFVNEQEGWLTCSRYIGLAPFRFVHLVFHTLDQGQHWVDVSDGLNRIAANDAGFINDVISDIKTEGTLAAMVLTGSGKIFKTDNGGQSWQPVGAIDDNWGWPWYKRFGFKDSGRLWVAGSADSSRGVWGMILEENNTSWRKYRLNGVYFADTLFVSDNQVLACGFILPSDDTDTDTNQRNGVILYSSDGGRNWSIIYRNREVKSINALATVDSTHIWAVGDDGLIVKLEPSTINVGIARK